MIIQKKKEKELGLPGELADSRTETCSTQNGLGRFLQCSESSKDVNISERYRSQSEKALRNKNCNNVSNQIDNVTLDYNSKFTINILESILMQIND